MQHIRTFESISEDRDQMEEYLINSFNKIENMWASIDQIIDDLSDDLPFHMGISKYMDLIKGNDYIQFGGSNFKNFRISDFSGDYESFDEIGFRTQGNDVDFYEATSILIEFRSRVGFVPTHARIYIYLGKGDYIIDEKNRIINFIDLIEKRILNEFPFFDNKTIKNNDVLSSSIAFEFSLKDLS